MKSKHVGSTITKKKKSELHQSIAYIYTHTHVYGLEISLKKMYKGNLK